MAGVCVLAVVAGCGRAGTRGTGAASISVQALSISDVASVTVTVSASVLPVPLVIPLSRSGNQFSALAGNLPVGTDYVFTASAVDGSSKVLYAGAAPNQSIVKNQTANIVIDMSQIAPAVPLTESAPVIDSITATSLSVSQNDTVTIEATAHDPLAGQTALMTWAWTSSCGTATLGVPKVAAGTDSTDGASSVVFTAPAADGPCTVNLTVSDATGLLHTVASLTIQVNAGFGGANVTANLDTYPVITNLTASPSQLVPGETTNLAVMATDADGDALTYAWSTPCPGSFTTPSSATTGFTLSISAQNTSCDFQMVVTDGNFPDGKPKGGVITNHITLAVQPIVVKVAPVITLGYQTGNSVAAGTVVGMAVAATDPAGGSLTYAWSATFGPAPAVTSAAALGLDPSQWTAAATFSSPTMPPAGTQVIITVTATSSTTGQSASHKFTLTSVCQCNGNGPGDVPVTVACGQSACGSDYQMYSCSASGFTLTGPACGGPDAGACQCSGMGPGNVPVTVACGQSACGSDSQMYSCSASGFTATGQPCGGPDAGACQCSGMGPGNVPVTVSCGQSTCGSDYQTYSCSVSGFILTGPACGGPDAGACQCSGMGPGKVPVTVACGQSACGSDYQMYSCSASGFTATGQPCGGPDAGACQCSGMGPGNVPVTVSCGQSTCGSDYQTYSCSVSGFILTGPACGGPDAGACECSGMGPGNVPVTVSCGQSTCGSDYQTYSCSVSGFILTGQPCGGPDAGACQCSGMGPGNVPVTVSCGQSACGSDYQTYSCSASGWSATGVTCP
jgi:hypothetical protein